MTHPGWHDRVATGDREPRQYVGQRPRPCRRVRQQRLDLRQASLAAHLLPDRSKRLRRRRSRPVTHRRKEGIKSRGLVVDSRQPVIGQDQVRRRVAQSPQCLVLVAKDTESQPCIELRVVAAAVL